MCINNYKVLKVGYTALQQQQQKHAVLQESDFIFYQNLSPLMSEASHACKGTSYIAKMQNIIIFIAHLDQ